MGISYSYYTKQATKLRAKGRVLREFREFVDERIKHYQSVTEKYQDDFLNDLPFEEVQEASELSGCLTEYLRLLNQINKEQNAVLKECKVLLKQTEVLEKRMKKEEMGKK